MIVGLDGKRAVENNTGLGNYSRYAVNMLSLAYPGALFRLYAPRRLPNERLDPLLARDNVDIVYHNGSFGAAGRALWRTVDMPVELGRDGVNVYHGLSNELPLTIGRVCPSVVTIHDLIYRRCPADYTAIDRRLYDFKYRRSARIATRVIAISECTRRDLVEDYQIDPEKIDVIYQGIDPIFSLDINTESRMRVRMKYNLPDTYIVSVGTIQPRKNQLLAVQALSRMPQSVHLVLVGRPAGSYGMKVENEIARLGLSDRVHMLQGIPFADLPAIYSAARASLYPSRYEGFGLPVVESIASGTPVVAATGSCLEEAGGDGAVYIHPDDADALARETMRILDDTIHRDRLIRRGTKHIRRFSPENFARETMAAYHKAIISYE